MKPLVYSNAFTRSIVMVLGVQIGSLFVRVVVGVGAIRWKVVRAFFRVQGFNYDDMEL